MKKILALLLAFSLAACSTITKVEGDHVVNERLTVKVTDAWNKMKYPGGGTGEPYEMWTQEGVTLDHLRLWAAIKPGQALMAKRGGYVPAGQKEARVPTYTVGMPMDQLVTLFEVFYSADGSVVKVTKVESTVFAGEKGVRFEFTIARKSDDVQLRGVGWAAVHKNELYAATFAAPRLAFFQRLLPMAEAVVKTARIRG